MNVTILKSKIHHAVITQSSLNYEGSITIDKQLMDKAGLCPYEKVLIANICQGTRFETYVISGKPGSRIIGLNGATARLGKPGDKLTIMAFTEIPQKSVSKYKPKVIILDKNNKIKRDYEMQAS